MYFVQSWVVVCLPANNFVKITNTKKWTFYCYTLAFTRTVLNKTNNWFIHGQFYSTRSEKSIGEKPQGQRSSRSTSCCSDVAMHVL